MTETPLEEVIQERQFIGILQTHAEVFFRLTNTLRGRQQKPWNPKHYYQLIHQANELESFLDDYGARYNRHYCFLTELVASLRAFAQAGYSLVHMQGRLVSYGIQEKAGDGVFEEVSKAADHVLTLIRRSTGDMLAAAATEASRLGMELTPEEMSDERFLPVVVRQRLPRNVGVEDIPEEEQRIAEVASKYLLACEMLDDLSVRRISDANERRRYLSAACTEEHARVYEATVHNLQSAYDTYIKNTVLESHDEGLPVLRGLASTALHLFEGVTFLTHFCERHESDTRSETAKQIAEVVDRDLVEDAILNHLVHAANLAMVSGRAVAKSLLRCYTNAQELEVDLGPDLMLHARPASLIVGIVNHYGTPVEMELGDQKCNAASILELLLAVGSHPDERRFVFRGDSHPLHDIGLLFQHGLGEGGLDGLPSELSYLQRK